MRAWRNKINGKIKTRIARGEITVSDRGGICRNDFILSMKKAFPGKLDDLPCINMAEASWKLPRVSRLAAQSPTTPDLADKAARLERYYSTELWRLPRVCQQVGLSGSMIYLLLEYQGVAVGFTGDGWFNATEAAEKFGKRVDHWLANAETKEYMEALAEALNTRNSGYLIKTKRGKDGGTCLHPKLAVRFAQWLDIRFAVWCDAQIDSLIRGRPQDWRKLRQEAVAGYQFMSAVLQQASLGAVRLRLANQPFQALAKGPHERRP